MESISNDANLKEAWTSQSLQHLLDGKWVVEPRADWCCWNLAIGEYACVGPGTLFIAIDRDRWLQGSGNTGVYAAWTDTHITLPKFQKKIVGAIVEHYIEGLDPSIPQLLVDNSYEAIRTLGMSSRNNLSGKVIAITGTAGKTSTKDMLHHLLEAKGSIVSTHGNHNTRTGVHLTLARCITQPKYTVLEVALSALWMRSGGICQFARPHIAIITEIALGQTSSTVNTVKETARMKARIAQGIEPGGIAILNRDMPEYDFVKAEVVRYGAFPMSYGFHEDADFGILEWRAQDKGSLVKAKIRKEDITYYLPIPGKGMISNSMAALAAVHALGIDPAEVMQGFESMGFNTAVLENLSFDLPAGGKVYILDDSHNAEAVSMKSALEVFRDTACVHSGKKICVLGRIVNLGENAEAIHREMSKAVINSGADLVFAYGNEMQYLVDELPDEMLGGFYSDITACAQAVVNRLEADDYILLKGSRRANDFGKIRGSILSAIADRGNQAATYKKNFTYIPHSTYCVQAMDAESGTLLCSEGNPYARVEQGVGGLVLLSLLLERIVGKKINLGESVRISSASAKDGKSANAMDLQAGEEVSVFTLLSSLICHNAPDAAIALAEKMSGSTRDALILMKAWGGKMQLSKNSLENITGRVLRSKPQSFDISDLNKAAKYLCSLPPMYLKMLNISTVEYKGKMFNSSTALIGQGKVFAAYFFGKNNGQGVALANIKGQRILLTVCGARDSFHLDYLLSRVIDHLTFPDSEAEILSRQEYLDFNDNDQLFINILGDTYFGEDYTLKRQKRGMEDALTKYGYDYSFQALEPILAKGDYNLLNFEAVLTDARNSRLLGLKPFILKGKVKESIDSLKKVHIDAVTLGNNHAMDYGVEGLKDTLQAFRSAGIKSIGAGYNAGDASEALQISSADRKIVIFNGYWYRKTAHHLYDMYAMGDKPGVACLNGELMDKIRQEKSRSPEAIIIAVIHWGVDFQEVKPQQRTYARQLINSGADLIIGHGAHMMQEIQQINGKWVFYGIGNGVFNSNGEYEIRKAPPYSFLVQLRIEKIGNEYIRLYPLFSNNLKSFWQPHIISEEQFKEVIGYQASVGSPIASFSMDVDGFGPFMETPI